MQGSSDVPLNAMGMDQAERLAKEIAVHHPEIAKTVYSSNLSRASTTAQKIQEVFENVGLGTINIIQMVSLQEFHFGDAEGILASEKKELYLEKEIQLLETYPDRKERWNYTAIPGSETYNELLARTKEALAIIAKSHSGEKVAVFTHGKVISTLLVDSESLPGDSISLPNCVVVLIHYHHDQLEKSNRIYQERSPHRVKPHYV